MTLFDAPAARAALTEAERLDWLRLARTPRVGPVTFADLLRRFGTARVALDNLPDLARRAGGAPPTPPTLAAVRAEADAVTALGGAIICACEPAYPARLAALDPPPPVITVLGHPSLLPKDAVALVGARNASAVGRGFARELATALGAAGIVVVSGLARGIDAAAHEGALKTGTVAVVAGGADHIYPPEHADLHARIIAAGAIVSERHLGAAPTAQDFPRRNRLISGLCAGVVVVEAAERSGSLITARFAAEQGREVFAVPGSPLDPRARGSNRLLKEGATLVEAAEDVLAGLQSLRERRIREPERLGWAGPPSDPETDADRAAGASARAKVAELLSPSAVHRDVLAREAGLPAGVIAAALLELELAGACEQDAGGYVRRT